MGAEGYVGGDPGVLAGAAAGLRRTAEEVAGIVEPFTRAVGGAASAAGESPADVVLAAYRGRWGAALDELAGQVRALGVVVDAAAADLAAADGS